MKWILIWMQLQTYAGAFYSSATVQPDLFNTKTECENLGKERLKNSESFGGAGIMFTFSCHPIGKQ